MVNWLEKIRPLTGVQQQIKNLPVKLRSGQLMAPQQGAPAPQQGAPQGKLPNASVIYAIAASILFVMAVYFLFTGLWFTGFLILLPAACFLGFALHFLKYWQ